MAKPPYAPLIWTALLIVVLLFSVVAEGQQPSTSVGIISPVDGTVVHPGDKIAVTVDVAGGASFTGVGVIAQDITFSQIETTTPFTFSISIPGDLIGRKALTAVGITSPGNGVISEPVYIDIETLAPLNSITVDPHSLGFAFAGEQFPLDVTGAFSDGSTLDITSSSQTTYRSTNPAVAIVDASGLVTATGAGAAKIMVGYADKSITVPVSVPKTMRGDLNGDGKVDKNDLDIILRALNTPATKPSDARDLNGDGVINALDARILVTLCTRPGCATH